MHHMIGGKHLQRATGRELTYKAFFGVTGQALDIVAMVFEGDRLVAKPVLEVIYQPAHGSVEDVVTARMVRFMNDTAFGEGTLPDPRWRNSWVHFGPRL